MMTWTDRSAIKTAKPRPDITISVMKWSRLWGWMIAKDDQPAYVARGTADTADDAKQNAETAWEMILSTNIMIQMAPPVARRWRG
jgi:hypothetical protein